VVLLVEDGPSAVRKLLSKGETVTAHTPAEAQRIACDRRPAAAVLPAQLARSTVGLVGALLSLAPMMRVIVVSEHAHSDEADAFLEAGAAAYLDRRNLSMVPLLVSLAHKVKATSVRGPSFSSGGARGRRSDGALAPVLVRRHPGGQTRRSLVQR
jgi:hypothetical protein